MDWPHWVACWAARYDLPHDDVLDGLRGLPEFGLDHVRSVVHWKYPGATSGLRAYRLHRIAGLVDLNSSATVTRQTRQAFNAPNEVVAMEAVSSLKGVGLAIGSALLMSQDPEHYTVFDQRASKSLVELGLLARTRRFNWTAYLSACRDLAGRAGVDLRTTDRALFCARGRTDLPAPPEHE